MVHVPIKMVYLLCWIIFLQILNLAYTGNVHDKLFTSQVIHIIRMDGQCRGKTAPVQALFQGIKSDFRVISVAHTTMTVKKDLVDNIKLTVTMNRCRSRENLDSCEEFYKMENLDYCRSINPDNIITKLSPLAIPFDPKLKCPIKKGTYQAHNYTFNLTPFVLPNMDGWYWRVLIENFSPIDNSLIYCMTVEANVYSKSVV